MSSTFLSSQLLQSASLIGKNVLSAGNNLTLNGTASFGVTLPQAVDNLSVSIKDAAGNVVRTMDLGPQAAGTLPLQWDGMNNAGTQAANGSYTFSVQASQGGNGVSATALSQNVVNSISQNAQGVLLNLGNSGSIGLADVKQIL
jgi:flagellar basal-body rod modification protein FlgD